MTTKPRLLVKGRRGRGMPQEGFRFKKVDFRVESLFETPEAEAGFSAVGGEQWFVAEAAEPLAEEVNPWDYAHEALEKGLGFSAAAAPSEVEPDLLQEWKFEDEESALSFAAGARCQFDNQKTKVPRGDKFAWFLDDDRSQLREARKRAEGGRKVRIAHLDTGYDRSHVVLPDSVKDDIARPPKRRLQRNFVKEDQGEHDASDPGNNGLLRNPGHGNSTLGILAGNVLDSAFLDSIDSQIPAKHMKGQPLGGAPMAEIVPMRVANGVALFRMSAVARAFEYATRIGCDVLSMSMGGLPSSALTEAVNRAYEAGLVMVCAAGNNFNGLPIRHIVYPARYRRVVAVCGVMDDGSPYFDLPGFTMQGNWGPKKAMRTAMAAYTPNMPWAELGCETVVDMKGAGTSAATPQVAAAAALWLMTHKKNYPERWMQVEAVRKALFESAHDAGNPKQLGHGLLRASRALDVPAAKAAQLEQTKKDSARFGLFKLLFRLGVAGENRRNAMFEQEASQLLLSSKTLEEILEKHDFDPEDEPRNNPALQKELIDAMAAEPTCSKRLRTRLEQEFSATVRPQTAVGMDLEEVPDPPEPPKPKVRPLRGYAFDPALGLSLDTFTLNTHVFKVRWEELDPGPVGEYLEIVDIDPASRAAYAPVDLDNPHILAAQGLKPSEDNPQAHQQMVYAVAMDAIDSFERALGRPVMWARRQTTRNGEYREQFVPRLRIYPHALREANAYYSPERCALLFGYFPASKMNPGKNLPGGAVFTCLSHDIVVHETTHALLDGIHPRFAEPSNVDVLAFHEAFADIVALFHHFCFPEVLRHQIARTRGDLDRRNLLGQLAQQFGEGIGNRGALRDAIGATDPETGEWAPLEPDPSAYLTEGQPHTRGSILVAAVFDAFLSIYARRSRDLRRLATGGTGVLSPGDIPEDLVNRLADEAAKTARHVLLICVRALEYCPPVDITFGDYLRALITADSDLVDDDPLGYRVAFAEAFRRRGIYPDDVRNLSDDGLRWGVDRRLARTLREEAFEDGIAQLVAELKLNRQTRSDRSEEFREWDRRRYCAWKWITNLLEKLSPEDRAAMGLAWGPDDLKKGAFRAGANGTIATEVHSVRPTHRARPDGGFLSQIVIEITQTRDEPWREGGEDSGIRFRGGCTLIIDPKSCELRHCIARDVLDEPRLERQRRFATTGEPSLAATYFGDSVDQREPFALLHRNHY